MTAQANLAGFDARAVVGAIAPSTLDGTTGHVFPRDGLTHAGIVETRKKAGKPDTDADDQGEPPAIIRAVDKSLALPAQRVRRSLADTRLENRHSVFRRARAPPDSTERTLR